MTYSIEKKAITRSAPGNKNYPVSVGLIGYTEDTADNIPGLSSHSGIDAKERLLVIESFYNYLASGSINDRRSLFKGWKVTGIGAVLLKKLGRLALAGNNSPLGITKKHEHIYVVGTKRQAWDNYRAYRFRPIGANAMTWRVKTEELMQSVREAKVVVEEMQPRKGPRAAKIPSLFSQALNALTTVPGNANELDDPGDPTLRCKVVLGGIVSQDGFVVSKE